MVFILFFKTGLLSFRGAEAHVDLFLFAKVKGYSGICLCLIRKDFVFQVLGGRKDFGRC